MKKLSRALIVISCSLISLVASESHAEYKSVLDTFKVDLIISVKLANEYAGVKACVTTFFTLKTPEQDSVGTRVSCTRLVSNSESAKRWNGTISSTKLVPSFNLKTETSVEITGYRLDITTQRMSTGDFQELKDLSTISSKRINGKFGTRLEGTIDAQSNDSGQLQLL